MAEALKDEGITVNAAYPGRVDTNIWQGDSFVMKIAAFFMKRKSISAEEGAETEIYLATSQEVEGITGQMFYKREALELPSICEDREFRKNLMERTDEVIGKALSLND